MSPPRGVPLARDPPLRGVAEAPQAPPAAGLGAETEPLSSRSLWADAEEGRAETGRDEEGLRLAGCCEASEVTEAVSSPLTRAQLSRESLKSREGEVVERASGPKARRPRLGGVCLGASDKKRRFRMMSDALVATKV